MRILAGSAKGRKLKGFSRKDVRVTSGKVKGAIFDVIGPYLDEQQFLDLFAGSGSVGIEALSRGAESCVFIEKNAECVKIINENLRKAGLSSAKVIKMDVYRGLKKINKNQAIFDYIFMDPPYFRHLYVPVLEEIAESNILKKKGTVIVEHHKSISLPEVINGLHGNEIKKYGDTCITFYNLQREVCNFDKNGYISRKF